MSILLFSQNDRGRILENMMETAIDGIFLITEQGTIVMVNTAGANLFGYTAEEIIGQNITMLMPSPHRELHNGYIQNFLLTGIKKIIGIGREIEGLRKDGTLFPARLAVSETILEDRHYFTGFIHDLTEMKAVENKILQLNHELEQMVIDRTLELQDTVNLLLDTNRQLNESIDKHKIYEAALVATRDELRKSLDKEKELSSLKSRFISMASHEFKTPLSSILSSASLISRYQEAEQAADRNRHVDRIKSSVNHLNTILTDFLSIARLDEGQLVPAVTRFSLTDLLNTLKAEMKDVLKKDQHLICETNQPEIEITSDKNMIRNILYNLVSNASKYSDEGKPIYCHITLEGQGLKMKVRDEGVGIPAEDQKHIGSRFFRASNAVNIPGTGLGLNIVISYLHALNGVISFESEYGTGTTFTITLPAHYEKQNSDH